MIAVVGLMLGVLLLLCCRRWYLEPKGAPWPQGEQPPFPYEVPCPVCRQPARYGCDPGGFLRAHRARYEASPTAVKARRGP